MHTWYYRLNALLTFATTVLAVMCAVASLTEVFHKSHPIIRKPDVHIEGLMVGDRTRHSTEAAPYNAARTQLAECNTEVSLCAAREEE